MENWGKCKKCRYADPTERDWYKWYFEWYRSYEGPDEVRDCPLFDDR